MRILLATVAIQTIEVNESEQVQMIVAGVHGQGLFSRILMCNLDWKILPESGMYSLLVK